MKGTVTYVLLVGTAGLIGMSGFHLPFYASDTFVRFSPWIALGLAGICYAGLQLWRPIGAEFFFESALANAQLHLILGLGCMVVMWGVLIIPAALLVTTLFGEPVTLTVVVNGKSVSTSRRGCDHWLDVDINKAPLHLGSCVSASHWRQLAPGDRVRINGKSTWFGVAPR